MQNWLGVMHGEHNAFPALVIAVKLVLTLALGLLVGFEREWSNKDIGARTFAMTALLGLLGALLTPELLLLAGAAVLVLIIFTNLRSLQVSRKLEATTSAALAVIFLLGVLVGQGHLFTPVACSILVAMLLSLKPQFRAFAGGLSPQEVRSAIVLALLGFVVWPLLPNRFIDRWQLIQPREAWIMVVVIACLGFVNYVLLRVYGSKGLYLTAIFGGLVNSTATVAELASTLSSMRSGSLVVPVVLLTSMAMFLRNVLILAIFAPGAIRTAILPLLAMSAIAGYWVRKDHRKEPSPESKVPVTLASPISLGRVLTFALLFLLVQIFATLGQRLLGSTGLQAVSILGGLVSSASTTAASATLSIHGRITAAQAGIATVLTSMASAAADLPIIQQKIKNRTVSHQLTASTLLQVIVGIAVLVSQFKLLAIL